MSDKAQLNRNHLSPWTIKEIFFIEENYSDLSAKEIGDVLGRRAGAVRQMARKAGLAKVRPADWTEEEHTLISMYYGKVKWNTKSGHLNRGDIIAS